MCIVPKTRWHHPPSQRKYALTIHRASVSSTLSSVSLYLYVLRAFCVMRFGGGGDEDDV